MEIFEDMSRDFRCVIYQNIFNKQIYENEAKFMGINKKKTNRKSKYIKRSV